MLRADVWASIEFPDLPVDQGRSSGRIGASCAETGEFEGGEGPILLHACLQLHVARGPVADAEVGLLPGQEELHRPGGLLGEQGRDDRILSRLQLASETASHVVANDTHVGQRKAKDLGDPCLDSIDSLGGLPYREPIPIPFGNAAMKLHGGVKFALGPVAFLQHHIGLGKSLLHVAPFVESATLLNGFLPR